MAEKVTARSALTQTALDDLIHIVDVSNTTDDPAGSSFKITKGNFVGEGSSFPGSPYTNQFWRHTTHGLCQYDGTQWLTDKEYSVTFAEATNSSSPGTTSYVWVGDANAIYVTRFELSTYVDTTNDANSYWRIRLLSRNLSKANASIAVSVNTSADAADTYVDNSAAIGTTQTYYGYLIVDFLKQGATATPGDITYSATAKYKLVVT